MVAIVESQHGPAGMGAGEVGRRRHADDVVRRRDVLHPERDAQVRVGPDLVADGCAGPLRRQHEVHAEAAAAAGDVDDRPQELG